jgi:hypothetical protein
MAIKVFYLALRSLRLCGEYCDKVSENAHLSNKMQWFHRRKKEGAIAGKIERDIHKILACIS